jgi:hypothetical protein
MSTEMERYDAAAWQRIEEWRDRRLSRRSRRVRPKSWQKRVTSAGDQAKERLQSLSGAKRFEDDFLAALDGLAGFGSRVAMASVRKDAVVRAYQKRGYSVEALADIHRLDLRDIDAVRPRLDLAYMTAATMEGAAAGFVVSGGELLASVGTVAGAGAGAAPGAGMVVGAMAADAAATLLASHRAIAHIAAYYGYDVDEPAERLFALGVLGFGTVAEAGKAAAYAELNKVVQALVRGRPWAELNKHVVTKIVRTTYKMLGLRLTQRKLGQAIPVVGVVLGAGLNARLLSKIADDADHLYRERFLRDKYALAAPALTESPAEEGVVKLSEVIEAEIVEESRSARALPTNPRRSVEEAIRQAVSAGDRLPTVTGRGTFVVHDLRPDGVVLLFGEKEAWTPLSWQALEGVADFLRGRGWTKIGSSYSVEAEEGTLDAYLKQHLKRATGGWVAVLLERAGVVELDRDRPAKVRLKSGY